MRHSFINHQQSDCIKKVKEDANENNKVIVHIDFAENHILLNQKEVMQAEWTIVQATIFTIHLKINKEKHHIMVVISDYLAHDVEFVHAAQGIINRYVQSIYPTVKQLRITHQFV